MIRVVCLGEALIDFVPLERGVSLKEAEGFLKAAGGAPANVAVGIARLGEPSAFIGKVGDDPFGHFLEQTLRENGVATRGMRFDPEVHTGLAFVSLRSDGERDFCFYRSPAADLCLRPEELATDLIHQALIFHFGSISLGAEPVRSATLAALKLAVESGTWISYDPNVRLHLWSSPEEARSQMLAVLPKVHLLKVSEEELTFLTDRSEQEAILSLFSLYPNLQVIALTRGARGSSLFTPRHAVHLPPYPVEAIDTTGAGDAYTAALLVSLLRLIDDFSKLDAPTLKHIGENANAAGAFATTRKGAIPALPTLEQLTHLLERPFI